MARLHHQGLKAKHDPPAPSEAPLSLPTAHGLPETEYSGQGL